jgi:uncharacterized protein with FMN-binding domain
MKRGLLIGVGTLGGLGAVFAITPPQFGTGIGGGGARATLSGGAATQAAPAQTQAAAPTPAQTHAAAPAPTATKKKSTKKTPKSSTTSSAAPSPAQTQPAAPAPAPSKPSTPAPAAKTGASGTFVGGTAQTRWGPVQVQINVKDGIITSVDPLQYPMSNGTDQYINKQAIPLLNGEVKNMSLATAMAEATKYLNGDPSATVGVGGASYTSSGYMVSLQSAIKKAGL